MKPGRILTPLERQAAQWRRERIMRTLDAAQATLKRTAITPQSEVLGCA
jgi:hypothetical protein